VLCEGNDPEVSNDSEICTIDATGGRPFQVTNNTNKDDFSPDYSPNGNRIAYVSPDGFDYEIYTIKARGGDRSRVTNDDTTDGAPSYSPDGKRIAYHSYDGYDFEIYTIKVGGGDRFRVTNNTSRDEFDPDYSPNGEKIAYSGSRMSDPTGTGYEIYTINEGGGGKTRVTNNDTSDTDPSWGSRP
jgi:TolB protein